MNLVRLGHYHTPTGPNDEGFCQTALVVDVQPAGTSADMSLSDVDKVNLAVWNHDGGQEVRRDVRVDEPRTKSATFHLSGDCPWKR